jgi:tetratricopeptide (TPR) repeat protein
MVDRKKIMTLTLYACTILAINVVLIPSIMATEYSFYNGTYFSVEYPVTGQVEENNTSLNFSDENTGHYVSIETGKYYPTIAILNNYSTFVNGSFDDMTMHFLETLKLKSQVTSPGVGGSGKENIENQAISINQSPIQPGVSSLEENASTLNDRGVDLYAQGKYDEAIKCYDEAIEIDPQSSLAWNNKGAALFSLGKYDEALQAYDRAIEIAPKYASAWNNKGSALYNEGKYNEAIQAYDRAIDIDSEYANAWHNNGLALKALGRTKDADAAFAKAKKLGYGY